MKFILKYLKGNKLKYVGAIISVILAVGFGMLQPLVIRATIDSVIGTNKFDGNIGKLFYLLGTRENLVHNLWKLAILIVLLSLGQNIFRYFSGLWSAQVSESFGKRIKDKMYDHIQNLSYDYHTKVETGDLIQRSTSDVETVKKFIGKQFIAIGRILALSTLTLVTMFKLNVKLALSSAILIPIIVVFSMYFFKKVRDVFKISDEAEASMTSTIQENLTGIRVVRAFAKQDFEIEKFNKRNKEFLDSRVKLIGLFSKFWSLSDSLCMLQIVGVFLLGVYMTLNHELTLGTLVAFVFYIERLVWPIRELGRVLTDAGQSSISLNRVQEILAIEKEDLDSGKIIDIKGNISIKNLSFGYEKDKEILKDISFDVKAGETVAILGATGSGKSTLMHLLVRLFDYKNGSIKIDDVDIRDINKRLLRKEIGIVLQEPFLYSKTIMENIKIANKKYDDSSAHEAAICANVHHVINEFPEKYKTLVGEQGVTLSGGQKQRVAIARTIIQKSKILIFDDSLSAVDSETDQKIREALVENNKSTTTFIISHRISTLSSADKIIVIEDGKISSIGTHKELINTKGLYKTIYDIERDNKLG